MAPKDRTEQNGDVTEPLQPSGLIRGTCADCYTWTGSRGSAHNPSDCPHLLAAIRRAKQSVIEARQWLADLTGEPS